MAFAARNEDGKWRLCKRMGKTFIHVCSEDLPGVEIAFSSQAVTKKCADELNERFWAEYDRHERLATGQPSPLYVEMLEVIRQHGGLTDQQHERIQP